MGKEKKEMMKQNKGLIILLVLLVILVGALFGIRHFNQVASDKEKAEVSANDITLEQNDISEITGFSYQVSGNTISFEKKEDTWYNAEDSSLSLDQDAVSALAQNLTSVIAKRELTGEEVDLDGFGLNQPSNEITITTAKGICTLTFGMENELTNQYYMMVNHDESKVYVLETSLPTQMNASVDSLIQKEEVSEDGVSTNNVSENTSSVE